MYKCITPIEKTQKIHVLLHSQLNNPSNLCVPPSKYANATK